MANSALPTHFSPHLGAGNLDFVDEFGFVLPIHDKAIVTLMTADARLLRWRGKIKSVRMQRALFIGFDRDDAF